LKQKEKEMKINFRRTATLRIYLTIQPISILSIFQVIKYQVLAVMRVKCRNWMLSVLILPKNSNRKRYLSSQCRGSVKLREKISLSRIWSK